MLLRCQRHSASGLNMDGTISLPGLGSLGQDANKIDDGIRSRDRITDSAVIKHIGLDDLRCLGRVSQPLRSAGMAHSQTYRRATPQKQRYQMPADEADSAKHRDSAGHDLLH